MFIKTYIFNKKKLCNRSFFQTPIWIVFGYANSRWTSSPSKNWTGGSPPCPFRGTQRGQLVPHAEGSQRGSMAFSQREQLVEPQRGSMASTLWNPGSQRENRGGSLRSPFWVPSPSIFPLGTGGGCPLWGRGGQLVSFSEDKKRIQSSKKSQSIKSSEVFWNYTFDKSRLKNYVSWFLHQFGEYKTIELLELLKSLGFEYATKAGISLGIDDLKIPSKKSSLVSEAENYTKITVHQYQRGEITGVERFQRLIETWHRTSEVLKQEVINYFEQTDILNPVYMMAFSGARGNISQVRQLVGMRGLMADPQGQLIEFPIRSNFREGLTLTEYIISSYGARKGIVDTALRTANAGYLTRRLVDVAQHVMISHYDCGTQKGIFLNDMKEGKKIIYSLQNRLIGRVLARDIYKFNSLSQRGSMAAPGSQRENRGGQLVQATVEANSFKRSRNLTYSVSAKKETDIIAQRNQEISAELALNIVKLCSKVFVRSPLTCETKKLVCQLCYGWSLAQGNLVSIGEVVGVIAAQSIGEPGTQLTMRTFHTGGVFSGDISDQIRAPFNGFVFYETLIPGTLIRNPEGKICFLTKNEGSVFFTKTKKTQSDQNHSEIKKFKIPSYTILFARNGEKVSEKQVIAQMSGLSRQQNIRDEAELTIKAELEGQFYSQILDFSEKYVGPILDKEELNLVKSGKQFNSFNFLDKRDQLVEAWNWGYSWILSGKIYKLPISSFIFPKIGDLISKNSIVTQIQWYVPFGNSQYSTIETSTNFGFGRQPKLQNTSVRVIYNKFKFTKIKENKIFFPQKVTSFSVYNDKITELNKSRILKKSLINLGQGQYKKRIQSQNIKFNLEKLVFSINLSQIKYKNFGYFLSISLKINDDIYKNKQVSSQNMVFMPCGIFNEKKINSSYKLFNEVISNNKNHIQSQLDVTTSSVFLHFNPMSKNLKHGSTFKIKGAEPAPSLTLPQRGQPVRFAEPKGTASSLSVPELRSGKKGKGTGINPTAIEPLSRGQKKNTTIWKGIEIKRKKNKKVNQRKDLIIQIYPSTKYLQKSSLIFEKTNHFINESMNIDSQMTQSNKIINYFQRKIEKKRSFYKSQKTKIEKILKKLGLSCSESLRKFLLNSEKTKLKKKNKKVKQNFVTTEKAHELQNSNSQKKTKFLVNILHFNSETIPNFILFSLNIFIELKSINLIRNTFSRDSFFQTKNSVWFLPGCPIRGTKGKSEGARRLSTLWNPQRGIPAVPLFPKGDSRGSSPQGKKWTPSNPFGFLPQRGQADKGEGTQRGQHFLNSQLETVTLNTLIWNQIRLSNVENQYYRLNSYSKLHKVVKKTLERFNKEKIFYLTSKPIYKIWKCLKKIETFNSKKNCQIKLNSISPKLINLQGFGKDFKDSKSLYSIKIKKSIKKLYKPCFQVSKKASSPLYPVEINSFTPQQLKQKSLDVRRKHFEENTNNFKFQDFSKYMSFISFPSFSKGTVNVPFLIQQESKSKQKTDLEAGIQETFFLKNKQFTLAQQAFSKVNFNSFQEKKKSNKAKILFKQNKTKSLNKNLNIMLLKNHYKIMKFYFSYKEVFWNKKHEEKKIYKNVLKPFPQSGRSFGGSSLSTLACSISNLPGRESRLTPFKLRTPFIFSFDNKKINLLYIEKNPLFFWLKKITTNLIYAFLVHKKLISKINKTSIITGFFKRIINQSDYFDYFILKKFPFFIQNNFFTSKNYLNNRLGKYKTFFCNISTGWFYKSLKNQKLVYNNLVFPGKKLFSDFLFIQSKTQYQVMPDQISLEKISQEALLLYKNKLKKYRSYIQKIKQKKSKNQKFLISKKNKFEILEKEEEKAEAKIPIVQSFSNQKQQSLYSKSGTQKLKNYQIVSNRTYSKEIDDLVFDSHVIYIESIKKQSIQNLNTTLNFFKNFGKIKKSIWIKNKKSRFKPFFELSQNKKEESYFSNRQRTSLTSYLNQSLGKIPIKKINTSFDSIFLIKKVSEYKKLEKVEYKKKLINEKNNCDFYRSLALKSGNSFIVTQLKKKINNNQIFSTSSLLEKAGVCPPRYSLWFLPPLPLWGQPVSPLGGKAIEPQRGQADKVSPKGGKAIEPHRGKNEPDGFPTVPSPSIFPLVPSPSTVNGSPLGTAGIPLRGKGHRAPEGTSGQGIPQRGKGHRAPLSAYPLWGRKPKGTAGISQSGRHRTPFLFQSTLLKGEEITIFDVNKSSKVSNIFYLKKINFNFFKNYPQFSQMNNAFLLKNAYAKNLLFNKQRITLKILSKNPNQNFYIFSNSIFQSIFNASINFQAQVERVWEQNRVEPDGSTKVINSKREPKSTSTLLKKNLSNTTQKVILNNLLSKREFNQKKTSYIELIPIFSNTVSSKLTSAQLKKRRKLKSQEALQNINTVFPKGDSRYPPLGVPQNGQPSSPFGVPQSGQPSSPFLINFGSDSSRSTFGNSKGKTKSNPNENRKSGTRKEGSEERKRQEVKQLAAITSLTNLWLYKSNPIEFINLNVAINNTLYSNKNPKYFLNFSKTIYSSKLFLNKKNTIFPFLLNFYKKVLFYQYNTELKSQFKYLVLSKKQILFSETVFRVLFKKVFEQPFFGYYFSTKLQIKNIAKANSVNTNFANASYSKLSSHNNVSNHKIKFHLRNKGLFNPNSVSIKSVHFVERHSFGIAQPSFNEDFISSNRTGTIGLTSMVKPLKIQWLKKKDSSFFNKIIQQEIKDKKLVHRFKLIKQIQLQNQNKIKYQTQFFIVSNQKMLISRPLAKTSFLSPFNGEIVRIKYSNRFHKNLLFSDIAKDFENLKKQNKDFKNALVKNVNQTKSCLILTKKDCISFYTLPLLFLHEVRENLSKDVHYVEGARELSAPSLSVPELRSGKKRKGTKPKGNIEGENFYLSPSIKDFLSSKSEEKSEFMMENLIGNSFSYSQPSFLKFIKLKVEISKKKNILYESEKLQVESKFFNKNLILKQKILSEPDHKTLNVGDFIIPGQINEVKSLEQNLGNFYFSSGQKGFKKAGKVIHIGLSKKSYEFFNCLFKIKSSFSIIPSLERMKNQNQLDNISFVSSDNNSTKKVSKRIQNRNPKPKLVKEQKGQEILDFSYIQKNLSILLTKKNQMTKSNQNNFSKSISFGFLPPLPQRGQPVSPLGGKAIEPPYPLRETQRGSMATPLFASRNQRENRAGLPGFVPTREKLDAIEPQRGQADKGQSNSWILTIRKTQPLFISQKGVFHVSDGDFVQKRSSIITLAYQRLKTGDIVQGIPKVEQFFEARTTKRGRLFLDSLPNLLRGLFFYYKKGYRFYDKKALDLYKKDLLKREKKKKELKDLENLINEMNTVIMTKKGISKDSLALKLKELVLRFNESKKIKNKTKIRRKKLKSSIIEPTLKDAVRQSIYKIQQIIVDGVQRVYQAQGVAIADKHLEIIVKQMTSRVKIARGGQTGFLAGETLNLDYIELVNNALKTGHVHYEPQVLGITRSSLQVKSFISSASFQQTSRVLSSAALSKKRDFLKGLKENVILGNLIPAGTGYYNKFVIGKNKLKFGSL